jgi:hypothetical protein
MILPTQFIPFNEDVNIQINPYITVTGNVTKFDTENRSFTMTPTQYILLTHTTSPFPIHAHFADSNSKKRWGADGPKVTVGSTITFGGTLQRVVREHTIDKTLQFAQVEVTNIAYLATRTNLTTSPTRTSSFSHPLKDNHFFHISEDGSPKTRKRWNWDDLQTQAGPSPSSSSNAQGKRKRDDASDNENTKREKTVDDDDENPGPPKKEG